MTRKKLLWQFYPLYLLITLAAVLAVWWYSSSTFRDLYFSSLSESLEIRSVFVREKLRDAIATNDIERIRASVNTSAKIAAARVTVIDSMGVVLGESHVPLESLENHSDRPEVMRALGGEHTQVTRMSQVLRRPMMFVAVPVVNGDQVIGVVRVALPTSAVESLISGFTLRVLFGGFIVAILAALALIAFTRRIARPLDEMRKVAQRFAKGNLRDRIAVPDIAEVAEVAEAMNEMAQQLDERIRTIVEQRIEQEAVLSSMVEGVLAVDADERIININQTAAQLIDVTISQALGRSVTEIVRNSNLQRIVSDTLGSSHAVEREIVIRRFDEDKYLSVHGTLLKDSDGSRVGAVIVLNDITRIRRLENMRRDFVANVSHELRTPITSIKGFVETLLDGAINSEEDARRFLEIIGNHADRLNAIIEDLLSLARIEQSGEQRGLEIEVAPVRPVLKESCAVCAQRAEERSIEVAIECDKALRVPMNRSLVEQAVINLVDNAIKYSPEDTVVHVKAEAVGEEVVIAVTDQGRGIPKEHHARLFERFYRVDRGRSRGGRAEPGGTGLGLAIVKHVAIAHRGRVTLTSEEGAGTTFFIYLPQGESRTVFRNVDAELFRPQLDR